MVAQTLFYIGIITVLKALDQNVSYIKLK